MDRQFDPSMREVFDPELLAKNLGGTFADNLSHDAVFGKNGIVNQLVRGQTAVLGWVRQDGTGHATVLYKSSSGKAFVVDGQTKVAVDLNYLTEFQSLFEPFSHFNAVTFP
jgi:hypothetical protein